MFDTRTVTLGVSDLTSTALNTTVTAGGVEVRDMEIRGVKAQQTVINTTDFPTAPVSDWSDGDIGAWNGTSGRFEPFSPISLQDWTTELNALINADSDTSTGTGTGQINAENVLLEEITADGLVKVTLTGQLTNYQEDDNISIQLSSILSSISTAQINELNRSDEFGTTTAARISGTVWTLNRENDIAGDTPITFTVVGFRTS